MTLNYWYVEYIYTIPTKSVLCFLISHKFNYKSIKFILILINKKCSHNMPILDINSYGKGIFT